MGNCASLGGQKSSSKRADEGPSSVTSTVGSTGTNGHAHTNNHKPVPKQRAAPSRNQKKYGKEAYTIEKDLDVGDEGSEGSSLKLMRNRATGELVAAKWVPREAGAALSKATEREIINHRKLRHPNIVCFREVYTTDTHLVIAMEYVAGGRFERFLAKQGRLPEKEARRYFGQLIDAVAYCHDQGVFHRALNMGNLLVEPQKSGPMVLKISDFAYSKNALLDSRPKTMIGELTFTCPELLLGLRTEDGQDTGRSADVWACGVILFYMLAGRLPFHDAPQENGKLTRNTAQNIVNARWTMPADVQVSQNCLELLTAIFNTNPQARISAEAIKKHAWFIAQPETPAAQIPLPPERQTVTEIREIIKRARERRDEMLRKRQEAQQAQSQRQKQTSSNGGGTPALRGSSRAYGNGNGNGIRAIEE